jgi:O-antigen/teichoic acid export membrane protein
VLIQELGADRYGAWGVCLAIVGYVSLLELGTGTAMAVDGARQLGASKLSAFIGLFDAGRAFYRVMAVTVLTGGAGLAWWASRSFHDSSWASEVADVALILAFAIGLNFLSAPYSSLAAATGRPDLPNLGRTVGTLAYGLSAAAALISGAGVRGVALSWAIGHVLANVYIVGRAYRRLPLRASLGVIPVSLRDLLRAGLPYWVNSLAWQLVFATDTLVIAARLGTDAVACYLPTFRFIEAINYAALLPLGALLPLTGVVGGAGDRRRLAGMLFKSASLALALVFVGGSFALALGPEVLARWVGREYYAGPGVLVCLVAFTVLRAVSASSANILASTGQMGRVATVTMVEGLLNLALSISMAKPLGISGVALGTVLAHLCVGGWVLPVAASSAIGTHVREWLWPACIAGLRAASPAMLTAAALRCSWCGTDGPALIGKTALFGVAAAAGLWILALTRKERTAVLSAWSVRKNSWGGHS